MSFNQEDLERELRERIEALIKRSRKIMDDTLIAGAAVQQAKTPEERTKALMEYGRIFEAHGSLQTTLMAIYKLLR